jgi:hypothetical protein
VKAQKVILWLVLMIFVSVPTFADDKISNTTCVELSSNLGLDWGTFSTDMDDGFSSYKYEGDISGLDVEFLVGQFSEKRVMYAFNFAYSNITYKADSEAITDELTTWRGLLGIALGYYHDFGVFAVPFGRLDFGLIYEAALDSGVTDKDLDRMGLSATPRLGVMMFAYKGMAVDVHLAYRVEYLTVLNEGQTNDTVSMRFSPNLGLSYFF